MIIIGANPGQNNFNHKFRHTNWYFDVYDAYYNGSLQINLDPPAGAPCVPVSTTNVPYSYFRIGQMKRGGGKYSRNDYDSNKLYFRLGRTTNTDYSCQFTPRKTFASFESSNNGLDHQKVWDVESSLSGDNQYDLKGSITTQYANMNNYFNVLPFASSNTTNDERCPSHFYMPTLNNADEVTMDGQVNATGAKVHFKLTDSETKWTVNVVFEGTAWDQGAKLDFASKSAVPVTTGEAKRVECANCDNDDEDFEEAQEHKAHNKGMIVGAIIGGIVFIVILGVGAFFAVGAYKKRQYREAKQVDQDDAWAMEDHHDEREFKDYSSTGLKPIASQSNLLPGYGVDTSYNAHRAPSPDPLKHSGLPSYSEHYTPLK